MELYWGFTFTKPVRILKKILSFQFNAHKSILKRLNKFNDISIPPPYHHKSWYGTLMLEHYFLKKPIHSRWHFYRRHELYYTVLYCTIYHTIIMCSLYHNRCCCCIYNINIVVVYSCVYACGVHKFSQYKRYVVNMWPIILAGCMFTST